MHLSDVTLPTRDLAATARYYRDRLELPTSPGASSVVVTVGTSRLVFEQRDFAGAQHLAFTVPTGALPAAKTWLAARAPLLGRDGADEFEGPPSWNSRSVYFDGPDGQVLELIERRELDDHLGGDAGPASLLCVSEVGVAVPDVLDAVNRLRDAGVPPYGNPPGSQFAAVGDAHGLLVLVTEGRAWMPTADRYAQHTPVTIRSPGITPTRLSADQILTS